MGSLINEMYAGKSGKHGKADKHHRGRRARPSPEKLAELVSEAEVDYDNYDGYNITTVSFGCLKRNNQVFTLGSKFHHGQTNHRFSTVLDQ